MIDVLTEDPNRMILKNKRTVQIMLIFTSVSLAWIVFLLLLYYLTMPLSGSLTIEKLGQAGDYFGLLSSLFTGLAFAGLVITILLQREDIKQQQKDSDRKTFENNFFELLRLRDKVIDSINNSTYFKKEGNALYSLYNSLIGRIKYEYADEVIEINIDENNIVYDKEGKAIGEKTEPPQNLSEMPLEEKIQLLDDKNALVYRYLSVEERYRNQADFENRFLAGYYSILETILEYIDEYRMPAETTIYLKILNSVMVDHERVLLFYHVSDIGREKLIKLVGKFKLFEDLNEEDLFDQEHKDYLTNYLRLISLEEAKLGDSTLRNEREQFFVKRTPYRD